MEKHIIRLHAVLVVLAMAYTADAVSDVIVIGAGASGLAAARELTNAGRFTVTVLEARANRYGGRIWTNNQSFNHPSGPGVDMGASFIHHGEDRNSVIRLLKEFQLPVITTKLTESRLVVREDDSVRYDEGQVMSSPDEVWEAFLGAMNYSQSNKLDISLKDALRKTKLDIPINDPLSQVNVAVQEFSYGAPIDDINAGLFEIGYEDAAPIKDKLPVEGYTSLLAKLVQKSSSEVPLKIRLGQEVTQITLLANQRVSVTCKDGTIYETDAVIVTLPLGVLKAEVVKFVPNLPNRKTQAIKRLGFAKVNKVALEFDRVFWPREMHRFKVALANSNDRGKLTIFDNFRPSSNLPILITYAVSYFGEKSERMSDSQLRKLALSRLRSIFGIIIENVTVTGMSRTRWLADPFSRGCYSYPAVGTRADDWDTVGEASPPLFFAGEHTRTREYGSVNTAIDTGRRAANQAMEYLNNRPSNDSPSMPNSYLTIAISLISLIWQLRSIV